MAKIIVRSKVGDTYHPVHGMLLVGQVLEIEDSEFGEEIFEKIEAKGKKAAAAAKKEE